MTLSAAARTARQLADGQELFDTERALADRRAAAEPRHDAATLLDFEEAHGRRHTGRKDTAIRTVLGLTPARYYVLLGRVITTPEALAHNPILVNTLLIRRAIADRAGRH